ncbi:MAG: YgiQ family radical SAM protein [Desulfobacteraceae bacterium 4572_123]|nr:MAG: YgiQ family radical SAM protein [Desulfobacteraceae bacterium 4572_123]
MFLPTTRTEMNRLGWEKADVILVTGDSYIDSPFMGIAVIGKVLAAAGFKVAVIAQPDVHSDKDISRLGEPHLFWGISGGSIDSMVANYTALKKRRKKDDYTPGGSNTRRPDRAVIVYANQIRRYFKDTCPIVLGGIEASLRRIAHYDFWSNRVRRSILFDARADYLVYGMGEKAVVALCRHLRAGKNPKDIAGIELDEVHDLDFERDLHPFYKKQGHVKALATIKFSLTTHRGCYGECNFCAIAVHQGRTIQWRSRRSILKEAELLSRYPDFKGYILDAGGPTANMYGYECTKKLKDGPCPDRRCLFPEICPVLKIDHGRQLALLREIRSIKGVKKVFVASGLRYDLLLADKKNGARYLNEIVIHHTSGQLKVAPEHSEESVLKKMGKCGRAPLVAFKDLFFKFTQDAGKQQFLSYYMIAAHPGCTEKDMKNLASFSTRELRIRPEQVQIFTPTPSTYSTLMYCTQMDPFTRERLFVEKNPGKKEYQKSIVTG